MLPILWVRPQFPTCKEICTPEPQILLRKSQQDLENKGHEGSHSNAGSQSAALHMPPDLPGGGAQCSVWTTAPDTVCFFYPFFSVMCMQLKSSFGW